MEQNRNNRKVLPFYALRLENLVRPRADLTVSCKTCGHEAVFPVIPVLIARGAKASMKDLERAFRCENCKIRGHVFIGVKWLEGER
jgi:hypothetical protein